MGLGKGFIKPTIFLVFEQMVDVSIPANAPKDQRPIRNLVEERSWIFC